MTALATLLTAAALAGVAYADCPTNIRDMAPTGFLASATRLITSPGERDATPGFEARIGVAGGMRAAGGDGATEEAAIDGSAGIGGELRAQRSGVSGCASADLIDVREASAHVTASGQVPLLFTGLAAGFTLDHDIVQPLSARPEYQRAPLSRIAVQFSSSFLDFGLDDEQRNHLRILVVPFTVEQALAKQDETSVALERRTSRMEAAMFRFVANNARGASGDYGLFGIEVDWTEPTTRTREQLTMPTTEDEVNGFARFSPLSLLHDGPVWGFELDGGVLSLAGPIDCDAVHCSKGWFRSSLRHAWQQWSLEGRVERDAFIATNDLPAIENRASVTASVQSGATRATSTAFVADTHAWLDYTEGGQRVGVRATLSHQLGHGFSGLVDSELVRANTAMPALESGARLLVSIAWQKTKQR